MRSVGVKRGFAACSEYWRVRCVSFELRDKEHGYSRSFIGGRVSRDADTEDAWANAELHYKKISIGYS